MEHYDSFVFFFFKQNTAYEMRISDWSSDVCSSDLLWLGAQPGLRDAGAPPRHRPPGRHAAAPTLLPAGTRSAREGVLAEASKGLSRKTLDATHHLTQDAGFAPNRGRCVEAGPRGEQPVQKDVVRQGDCIALMEAMPEASVDMVFADPP